MAKTIKIKQVRGLAQCDGIQRSTVQTLGCHGIGTIAYQNDSRPIRGMLNKVQHLVSAELLNAPEKPAKRRNLGYTLG